MILVGLLAMGEIAHCPMAAICVWKQQSEKYSEIC